MGKKQHLRLQVHPLTWELIPQIERAVTYPDGRASVSRWQLKFLCFTFEWWKDFSMYLDE